MNLFINQISLATNGGFQEIFSSQRKYVSAFDLNGTVLDYLVYLYFNNI